MRTGFAVLALGVTLTGCMLPSAGGTGGFPSNQVLSAYITPPTGGSPIGFRVSRPAYVAVFEVIPGRGTALVHPSGMGSRSDGLVYAGWHTPRPYRVDRDLYYSASFDSRSGFGEPRFFFLIASEQPLDLGQLGPYGMGLRSMMGAQFAMMNAYSAMEQLTRLVVPDLSDPSWTTDMYVHWPEAFAGGARADYVMVSCNGYRLRVRRDFAAAVHQKVCVTSNSPTEPIDPGAPGDSGQIVTPERRAPQPRAEPNVRERITSSNQLRNGGDGGTAERRFSPSGREWSDEPTLRERSPRRATGDRAIGEAPPRERSAPSDRANRRADPATRGAPAAEPSGGRGRSAEPPSRREVAPRAEPAPGGRSPDVSSSGGSRREPACDPCSGL